MSELALVLNVIRANCVRKKKRMPTVHGVPRRSPIQVLTIPNVA